MIDGPHVLVVDGLTETQEVLQTILAAQGLKVERVGHAASTAKTQETPLPDVVVIDTDFLPAAGPTSARWIGVPQVIIGSAQIADNSQIAPNPRHRHLSKPFLFPDLIRAVEQLLRIENPEES